jgi:hypothetical protein
MIAIASSTFTGRNGVPDAATEAINLKLRIYLIIRLAVAAGERRFTVEFGDNGSVPNCSVAFKLDRKGRGRGGVVLSKLARDTGGGPLARSKIGDLDHPEGNWI